MFSNFYVQPFSAMVTLLSKCKAYVYGADEQRSYVAVVWKSWCAAVYIGGVAAIGQPTPRAAAYTHSHWLYRTRSSDLHCEANAAKDEVHGRTAWGRTKQKTE